MFVSKEKYKACIYTRLSKDDGDKPESDSIGNQKALIRDFIKKHPEIEVVSEKSDDGYSGVNFERPGFKEMMDEIRAGQVDCVIVKDLSRFGRDYIETGNYLEKIFPFLGERFISITDHFDSFSCGDAESALMIPQKNMVNDIYAKDISRKIITSFRQRQETGDFLPGNPPYGYIKSKERQFRYDVDEKVAPYIRMLFEWKDYPLWRKVRCGSCGREMPLKSEIVRGVDYRYFYCQHAVSQAGEGGCTKEYMREDVLNEVV
ncbi:recombinase family protein [[Ruminococcus] torques]|nr:recombinase family protein [[Ruminococcus] torques]MDM8236346.1 recombinase family protein [[Ruminococcus] torques]